MLLLVLLAGFSFDRSIGVAYTADERLCIAIEHRGLAAGTRVTIIVPAAGNETARRIETRIAGAGCPEGPHMLQGARYQLVRETKDPLVGIAVTGARSSLDLDGDGRAESFRQCASGEGLHLTVWSGAPLKGRRRWHRYVYLGYDTEPDCQPADYR